jgi:hypothetical protein
MDKTKQAVTKILAMTKRARDQVVRAVFVCALGSVPAAVALADEGAEASLSSGLGLGGAYLFGLFAGLVMFAVGYAIDVRKSHLAAYGK